MAAVSRRWLLGCLVSLVLTGCTRPVATAPSDDLPAPIKPTGKTVKLVIDFDDGLEKHYLVAWREGMTVLDSLSAASNRRRGIFFEHRGEGDRALVTAIDGVANESGGDGKAWLYEVNGESGKVSAGAQAVEAGDVILWRFRKYE